MKPIPVEDYPQGGMVALTKKHAVRVDALEAAIGSMEVNLRQAKSYSDLLLSAYTRQNNPFIDELVGLHNLGRLLYPMNGSLEYGCTAGANLQRRKPVLWRALDWPWDGMGNHLLVVKMPSPYGVWVNVTWPNFVGTATALAPGRFALAVNQAPSLLHFAQQLQRMRVLKSPHLSPLHFARKVMSEAPDFATAKQMLQTHKLNTTAIFTLVGCATDEICVIEHMGVRSATVLPHDGVVVAANHWQGFTPIRVKTRAESKERLGCMRDHLHLPHLHGFDWLVPPVLNSETRVAVEACPATGTLKVRGVENELLVTHFNGKFEAA